MFLEHAASTVQIKVYLSHGKIIKEKKCRQFQDEKMYAVSR